MVSEDLANERFFFVKKASKGSNGVKCTRTRAVCDRTGRSPGALISDNEMKCGYIDHAALGGRLIWRSCQRQQARAGWDFYVCDSVSEEWDRETGRENIEQRTPIVWVYKSIQHDKGGGELEERTKEESWGKSHKLEGGFLV